MIRPQLFASAIAVAVACPARAQTFSFVTTLGRDTLAFEQFSQVGDTISGDWVTVYGGIMVHHYQIVLGSDGSVSRYHLELHRASGKDEGAVDIRFDRDSAIIRSNDGKEQRVEARGTFPVFANTIALIDLIVSRARTRNQDSSVVNAMPAFGPYRAVGAPVAFFGRDSLRFGNPRAPIKASVGGDGHLTGTSASASTTRTETRRVSAYDIRTQLAHFPNVPDSVNILGVPSLSPRDTMRVSLADASITIDYGRPSVRGRAVFRRGVLGDTVWRAGANAATQFTTTADLTVGGQPLPAGTYSVWVYVPPDNSSYELIFNSQYGQWGTEHHFDRDVLAVPLTRRRLSTEIERFTIDVESLAQGGTLRLQWADLELSVPVAVRRGSR